MISDYKELSIDIETFSDVDITNGVYAYSDSDAFEIVLVGYSYNGEPVKSFMPKRFKNRPGVMSSSGEGQVSCFEDALDFGETGDEDEFLRLLRDPAILKTAYNANFERTCLARYYGVTCDPDEWRCTMILAVQLGLPRSLKDVGEALGLSEDEKKLQTGAELIRYFCKPCRPTKSNDGRTRNYPRHDPAKWKLFIEYNLRDVETEQVIRGKLRKYSPNAAEQALWSTDQRICDRGIRVNKDMAAGIVEYEAERHAELIEEARKISGLDNPNSIAQLKAWFGQRGAASLASDCSKDAVRAALGRDYPPDVRRMLQIRQSLGKTSTKKYDAILHSVCKDGRVRGMLQFYGANRTGRWAGRIVQLQNLPQNHIDDLDVVHDIVCEQDFGTLELMYGDPAQIFSELIRTAFIPSEDCRFVVTDFSAIEARVIAWLAGERWRLEVFENGGDIYCASATKMFHVPVVKHGVNGHLRQQGKVAELALGYGGGPGAIAQMDKGGAIAEADRRPIVDQWRAASPHIVKLWRRLENAAKTAIRERSTAPIKAGSVAFYYRDDILFCRLPSGRSIAYWGARLEEGQYGEQIAYWGVGESKSWMLLRTYGGKLTENVVQATARDCLAVKMMQAEKMGYRVVAHVHDEMIIDVPNSDTGAFKTIDDLMAEPITWAPGLPLKGGTYECPYYQKD